MPSRRATFFAPPSGSSPGLPGDAVSQRDRVGVVAIAGQRDQLHRRPGLQPRNPQPFRVPLRHHDDQRETGERRQVGERPRRIAGRRQHQRPAAVLPGSHNRRRRLELLEAARLHVGADLRPVAVERDVQVNVQLSRKAFAPVGDRRAAGVRMAFRRQPVVELPHAGQPAECQPFCIIFCPDQRITGTVKRIIVCHDHIAPGAGQLVFSHRTSPIDL